MNRRAAAVIAAGCLWGFMGFFTRRLTAIGVSSEGAIILRCGIAALLFGALIAVKDPRLFAVKPRHFWCFLGSGLCSLLFFTYCYFKAIGLMSLSTAAILLYTAPAIVMLLSALLFGEKLTWTKLTALCVAFAGCVLVSGAGSGAALTTEGLLYGLGSGVGYALYSIFARLAMDRGYDSLTVNFWSCLLAAAGAAVIWGGGDAVGVMFSSAGGFALSVAAAGITCFLPYLAYTWGLFGMEPGRASIMATVEPVVATLVGVFIFREKLTVLSALGVCLVVLAVAMMNVKRKQNT